MGNFPVKAVNLFCLNQPEFKLYKPFNICSKERFWVSNQKNYIFCRVELGLTPFFRFLVTFFGNVFFWYLIIKLEKNPEIQ